MFKQCAMRLSAAIFGIMFATGGAFAADPYKINVIMPLTGGASFLGKGQQVTLDALKAITNREGGVAGRDLEFVYRDDQSNPQTAVQLTNAVLEEKPAVVIGSSLVAMCNAMAPLFKSGPVDYCLSPGVHPPAGSFQFSGNIDTRDLMDVMLLNLKLRGWTRIAFMTSTDASGQDAERGFDESIKKPEHAGVEVVERQRFTPGDVSVAAQIERIKAAKPQAFVAWSTGAPIATIFKGMLQAGLDVPVITTSGNQTFAQFDQYKDFLPKDVYLPVSAYLPHKGLYELDPRVETEQAKFYAAHKAAGIDPDNMATLAWDPANIIITALRKLGTGATGAQIREYIAGLPDYPGAIGLYNFKETPQRGVAGNSGIMARWEPSVHNWVPASKPTGLLLAK